MANRALDAVFDPGLVFEDQHPDIPIFDQSAQQLAEGISITINNEGGNTNGGDVALALRQIGEMNNGLTALRARLNDQSPVPSPAQQDSLINATDTDVLALRQAEDMIFKPIDGHTDAAATSLRSVTRRSSDGARVSKQEHEYRYCRDSGQIDLVFELAGIPRETPMTFGRFVDSPQLRKAIECIRRVNRCVRSANVKKILTLIGISEDDLRQTIREQTSDFTDKMVDGANEWNGLFDDAIPPIDPGE